VARSLSEQLGALTAAVCVYLAGGAFCLAQLGWRAKSRPGLRGVSRKYLFGGGPLFIGYTLVLFLAVGLAQDRQQTLEIGLLNYLWPVLTILFSLALLPPQGPGRRADWLLVPGTGLALAGIVLVMTQEAHVSWASFLRHWQSNPAAYFLALAAAASWALYSVLTRRWSGPEAGGAVAWFIPATGLALLGLRLVGPAEPAVWSARAVGEAVFLGAVTALAYNLWEYAMQKGNLLVVAAASYCTPLFSTLVSCAYLKVAPGPKLWAGCALLVLGSLLTWVAVGNGRRQGQLGGQAHQESAPESTWPPARGT
jgi:drug/metabolite transporter (DMT)-like permease